MVPRKVVGVGVHLLGVVIGSFTLASPSNGVPKNALGGPAPSFGDSSSSGSDRSIGSGGSLSSPISGKISFRTKTGNGVRGVVPLLYAAQYVTAIRYDYVVPRSTRYVHVFDCAAWGCGGSRRVVSFCHLSSSAVASQPSWNMIQQTAVCMYSYYTCRRRKLLLYIIVSEVGGERCNTAYTEVV